MEKGVTMVSWRINNHIDRAFCDVQSHAGVVDFNMVLLMRGQFFAPTSRTHLLLFV